MCWENHADTSVFARLTRWDRSRNAKSLKRKRQTSYRNLSSVVYLNKRKKVRRAHKLKYIQTFVIFFYWIVALMWEQRDDFLWDFQKNMKNKCKEQRKEISEIISSFVNEIFLIFIYPSPIVCMNQEIRIFLNLKFDLNYLRIS